MMAFKRYNTILQIVFLNLLHQLSAEQLYLNEGNICTQKDGVRGVCQKAKTCKWIKEQNIARDKLITCSYLGWDTVVCCNDVVPMPYTIKQATTTSAGAVYFNSDNDDNVGMTPNPVKTTLKASVTTSKTPPDSIKLDRKSEIACNLFNNEASKLNPQYGYHIINGWPAEAGEFPHMAAIGYKNALNEISYDCGGSLIAKSWILTAAHCVNKRDREPTTIRLGKITLLNNDDEQDDTAQDLSIKKVHIHPLYTSRKKYNDIALIELSTAAQSSITINPACLYTDKAPITEALIVSGWGVKNTTTRERSGVLLKANLTFMGLPECHKQFEPFSWFADELPEGMKPTQLCAIDKLNRADTCQGDSGGPIQIKKQIGPEYRNYVVGLTSFGVHCGSPLPSVYTRVSGFLDWIEEKVWPGEVTL